MTNKQLWTLRNKIAKLRKQQDKHLATIPGHFRMSDIRESNRLDCIEYTLIQEQINDLIYQGRTQYGPDFLA